MQHPKSPSTKALSNGSTDDRQRIEILHFASDDAQRQAIGVLIERGLLNFSSNRLDEWIVWTSVARKLREHGVPFDWVTENA